MWWPANLEGLEVEETEEGLNFSAPRETPAGEWLHFWNSSHKNQKFFKEEIIKTLLEHADMVISNKEQLKTHSESHETK